MKSHLHILNDYRRMNRLLHSDVVFCAVDTETTGLKPAEEKIIEIGAIKFDKKGVIGKFSVLLNPHISISPFCTELTGITNEMLSDKKDFGEIIEDFLNFLGEKTIIVAHNAQFDIRFLNEELARINFPRLENKAIDTLRFSRWAFPQNEHWTLGHLANQFGIEVKQAHRAFDDARVCMEVFFKCIEGSMDKQKSVVIR